MCFHIYFTYKVVSHNKLTKNGLKRESLLVRAYLQEGFHHATGDKSFTSSIIACQVVEE